MILKRTLSILGLLAVTSVGMPQVLPSGGPVMELNVGLLNMQLHVPVSPVSVDDCIAVVHEKFNEWDSAFTEDWILGASWPWGSEAACFMLPPGTAGWLDLVSQSDDVDNVRVVAEWDEGSQYVIGDEFREDLVGFGRAIVVKLDRGRDLLLLGSVYPEPASISVLKEYLDAVLSSAVGQAFAGNSENMDLDCTLGYSGVSGLPPEPLSQCVLTVEAGSEDDDRVWVSASAWVVTEAGISFQFP